MSHAEPVAETRYPRRALEIRAPRFDRNYDDHPHIGNLLAPALQARLREIATLVEFDQGEVIFTEDAQGSHIYFVTAGMVRLSRYAASGRRQVISFMLPGDVFGFPQQGCYLNSARTLSAVTLFRVSWQQLNVLMEDEPQLQGSLLTRVAFDLAQAQKRILVLGQQNVSQRLASFMLDLMEHEDFYHKQQKLLSLPLSRFDLGDYLGTSPETVVRVLAKLEKDGLIQRVSPRLLMIPSQEALARLLRGRRRND